MNKDGDITDEEIVAFCENVGIAGKENQLAALAKNLINMVTNKDGKDIEIKTSPPAGSGSANNESAAEESTPEKTITSFEIERQKALEEYKKATNNTFLQIRLEGASEYSPLSISALNSLLNGSASSNYKLNFDRTEVTSGNYAIFDTRTNKYIDPAILKADNGSNPDSTLQKNLESGAWVIKIPKTAGASGSEKTIQTWSDLAFDSDSRFSLVKNSIIKVLKPLYFILRGFNFTIFNMNNFNIFQKFIIKSKGVNACYNCLNAVFYSIQKIILAKIIKFSQNIVQ